MVGMFTPVPLYVAGIVYAIHKRVCCRCCCPNETERAEKEAQKQERREKRALRRQAREQKKLKKKNEKEGQEGSPDTHGPEEIPLKSVASTETYITGDSDSSNNGAPLVDAPVSDVDEKLEENQQSTALGATVGNDNQFKVDV